MSRIDGILRFTSKIHRKLSSPLHPLLSVHLLVSIWVACRREAIRDSLCVVSSEMCPSGWRHGTSEMLSHGSVFVAALLGKSSCWLSEMVKWLFVDTKWPTYEWSVGCRDWKFPASVGLERVCDFLCCGQSNRRRNILFYSGMGWSGMEWVDMSVVIPIPPTLVFILLFNHVLFLLHPSLPSGSLWGNV